MRRERDREGDSSLYTVALSASCVYQAVRRERDREGDSSLYTEHCQLVVCTRQ